MARIVIVEAAAVAPWRLGGGRFAPLAALLRGRGHRVDIVQAEQRPGRAKSPDVVLTSLNRAAAAAALETSNRLAHRLADLQMDLLIAPLRGGVAQGVLNARACGEAFDGVRVTLWCDGAEALDQHATSLAASGVAPLIVDALERQCVSLADMLVSPTGRRDMVSLLRSAGAGAVCDAPSPVLLRPRPVATDGAPSIAEIVFVGPFAGSNGGAEFVYVVEELVRRGELGGRKVVFLGPVEANRAGVGAQWLGMRAQQSEFAFAVQAVRDLEEGGAYLHRPDRLGVMVTSHPDEAALLRRIGGRHVVVEYGEEDRETVYPRLLGALRGALAGDAVGSDDLHDSGAAWDRVIGEALVPARAGSTGTSSGGVSVCILHKDRPQFLRRAVTSVPEVVGGSPVEIVVVDNASAGDARNEVREIVRGRASARLVELAEAEPFARAHNRGLTAASRPTVVFHDDDNVFAPGGVERLWRALERSAFDIVVTPLAVFDEGPDGAVRDAGRLVFLGAAHSAGLFFNGFGDTSMAVRRDRFAAMGGFIDVGFPYPCADWATLARAHARGLRIGALQWPAVRYRRDMARAERSSQKLDQEGARSIVRAAYAGAFDPRVVARAAQTLHLAEW